MNETEKEYWKNFLPFLWKEIKLWFGWTDILNALLKTGLPIFGIVLAYVLGISEQTFIDSVILQICGWLGFIVFVPFGFIISYLRANQNLYVNQKKGRTWSG